MLNAKLEKGDRVILMHMEDETHLPGLKGTVENVMTGPIGEKIYGVKWDDGTSLSLLSDVDIWKKIDDKNLNESRFETAKWFIENQDIAKNFDTKFLMNYLIVLRDSGIVNMFGSAPYLYMGEERIRHEHKYDENLNEEKFEELVEMANDAQSKMINGVLKVLEKEKKEADTSVINTYLQKYSTKIVNYYINVLS